MNVKEIIKAWLKEHKYEGLFNSDIECGCKLDDFMPCGEMRHDCEAGYIQPGSHDGFDFMVGADKPPKQPEPPAPDISKGVWFESNGKWQYQGQDFRHDLTAIMVKGEKFVREDRSKKPQADAWTEVLMACYNLGMETDVKSLTGLVSVLNFIHALYENAELVRRLAKWSRHRSGLIDPDVEDEFHAIENEAVRLHPETKGE